ncbi:hypothetical protein B0J13DRAFT_674994 [Dactylonectria estremocensis]|uniref:Uncharacterized protein n=1 Tax=Dactylonectria estremocensis TaxID=1079267 RepID=A0A9P9J9B1_9HYPO|nr:hypothetical protein B0J13DRAFT_674994 [Dactylonectria estremocensis]
MPPLPREPSLPGPVRENLLEQFDRRLPDLERKLSEVMETQWRFDIDPQSIYPYTSRYSREILGGDLYRICERCVDDLDSFKTKFTLRAIQDINTLCPARAITIRYDERRPEDDDRPIIGCNVSEDGMLRVRFGEDNFGHDTCPLEEEKLLLGLDVSSRTIGWNVPFRALAWVRRDFDDEIPELRDMYRKVMRKHTVDFRPDFGAVQKSLGPFFSSKGTGTWWEAEMGKKVLLWMKGIAFGLGSQGFQDDEMLREAYHEAVHTGVVGFRIVEKLVGNGDDEMEFVIEDGVLYLQCTADAYDMGPSTYGAMKKLADLL